MKTINKESFGTLPSGEEVYRVTLNGAGGLSISLLTYGATVQAIRFAGRDVALGFDDLAGYLGGGSFQGATIGRYGNRIAAGRFPLGGRTVDVGCNENGVGHLHGGVRGFDKRLWDVTLDETAPSATFTRVSADGEEGYSGRLEAAVRFTVTADNTLCIAYTARSDADTVVNLTNHTYFNLDGGTGDVLDTELQVLADAYTPVDARLIPTGEQRAVAGTPFDFRTAKPIGRDIDADDDQLRLGGGYDHNFVLNGSGLRTVAVVRSPHSGIVLTCATDQPGMQVYTGNSLAETAGKGGVALYRRQGFCLETQHFPDSPNHPDFPSTLLRAGETYQTETQYHFEA